MFDILRDTCYYSAMDIELYLNEWQTDGKDRRVYRVPALFYADHIDRACGLTDKVLKRGSRIHIVELDYAGYQDLLSDADYYWEMRDEMDRSLSLSARSTIEALLKAGSPVQYMER